MQKKSNYRQWNRVTVIIESTQLSWEQNTENSYQLIAVILQNTYSSLTWVIVTRFTWPLTWPLNLPFIYLEIGVNKGTHYYYSWLFIKLQISAAFYNPVLLFIFHFSAVEVWLNPSFLQTLDSTKLKHWTTVLLIPMKMGQWSAPQHSKCLPSIVQMLLTRRAHLSSLLWKSCIVQTNKTLHVQPRYVGPRVLLLLLLLSFNLSLSRPQIFIPSYIYAQYLIVSHNVILVNGIWGLVIFM